MKKTLILLIMFAAIMYAQQTASAQASFVPTFDNNKGASLHLGFGQLNYDLDINSDGDGDAEFDQTVAIFGANFESHSNMGLFHFRIGAMGLGQRDVTYMGTTQSDSTWEDHQDAGFYMGGGYMFMAEMPMGGNFTTFDPYTNAETSQAGMIWFFGGGIDFNLYAQSTEEYISDEIDHTITQETFYVFDAALVGICGVRFPQHGFILHFGVSGHFLLGWEYRTEDTTGSVTDVEYASDNWDLVIPFLGMEAGITYEVPSYPRVRFGMLVKAIHTNMVMFHLGYIF